MAGGAEPAGAARGLVEIALSDVHDLDGLNGLDEHLGDLLPFLEDIGLFAQVNHDDLNFAAVAGIHHARQPVDALERDPALVPDKPDIPSGMAILIPVGTAFTSPAPSITSSAANKSIPASPGC